MRKLDDERRMEPEDQPMAGPRSIEHRPPLFSVIVPCLGHAEELRGCLRGLVEQEVDFPYEILVADSAADPAVAAVVADFPGIGLLRSEQELNLPPWTARNLGGTHAQGRYLAFTDADCVPLPDWLASARESLDAGARLTGGPVLDLVPWHPIASVDNLLQFADFLANRPDGPARYFPGCNVAISRSDFQSIGGFPEGVDARSEDTLFCIAAGKRWPGKLYFKQRMRIRHRGRFGFGAMWRHQWAFGYYRALLGLQLKPIHRRLGRYAVYIPLVMGKRLSYIAANTIRWNPVGLVRIILLFPLLYAGLLAWALGFYQGMNSHHRGLMERE